MYISRHGTYIHSDLVKGYSRLSLRNMCVRTLSYSDLASVLVLLDQVYMHAHTLTYKDSTNACTCISKQKRYLLWFRSGLTHSQ